MSAPTRTASLTLRERGEEAFYEAMFRHDGRQVKRRIGPAWLERDDAGEIERSEHERRSAGFTFREVAQSYLRWLEDVKGAKPSTLADYRYLLAEPGVPYKRGQGESAGLIMAALGDLSAAKVSVRDI